jgi:capsular polysaccharide transport system permease protein
MSRYLRIDQQNSLFVGFAKQANVIGALAIRELQGRFGRHNIGYLWMIGEPMMLASVMGTIHEVGGLGPTVRGIHPFAFTLLGYNIFIIFRNVFNRADHMLDNSSHLLYHRIITPTDIVIGKSLVEILGTVASLAVLMTAGNLLGVANIPVRPLYLMESVFLMSWLSISFSMLIAAYTYDSHLLSRFVHPFSYFMIPLSGAFFSMHSLPEWARYYMAWNPLMCIFEIARYGQFEVSSDQFLYPGYVVAINAFASYWGLIALRHVRRRISVQ